MRLLMSQSQRKLKETASADKYVEKGANILARAARMWAVRAFNRPIINKDWPFC